MAQTQDRRLLSSHPDALVGLGLVAACAALFWMTAGFPEVPAMLSQNVPPTFFPRLILTAIALLSVGLVIRGLVTTQEPKERIEPRVFLTAAIVTAAVLLMELLGTLVTVSLLAVVMPLSWGERRFGLLVGLAAALPVAIYLIFTLSLDVRFPPGLLAVFSR